CESAPTVACLGASTASPRARPRAADERRAPPRPANPPRPAHTRRPERRPVRGKDGRLRGHGDAHYFAFRLARREFPQPLLRVLRQPSESPREPNPVPKRASTRLRSRAYPQINTV